ncbi:hypothetical protein [Dactylosporangium maewongense]
MDIDEVPWDERRSGWRSDYLPAPVQLGRQRDRLLALVGRRVTEGWTGWDVTRDRWFEDIPLVLVFDDGSRLELQWKTWDHLSVTWGTIDFAAPLDIGVGGPYAWRSSAPGLVAAIVGRVVTEIGVTESPFFSGGGDILYTEVEVPGSPVPGGTTNDDAPLPEVAGWLTEGLWFATGDVGLHVRNGLDANALGSAPVTPGNAGMSRVTPLSAFGRAEGQAGDEVLLQ